MSPPILINVIGHGAALAAAYALGIGFVLMFVPTPSLVDMVSACKIVSLLALVYANRETPENIDIERHVEVSVINFAIVIASILVLLLMVVKTVVDDYAMLQLPQRGRVVLTWFDANAYWVSTVPIFGYFALDLYLSFRPGASPSDHETAREFLVFRDLVCVGPLALVLLLAELYSLNSTLPDARESATFFFGGALTVILLASAVATKALNLSQTARRAHDAKSRTLLLVRED
jgi:hypothetical protein